VKVEALSFSCDGNYLASVGGQDDGKLVVWDVQTGKAVCGSPVPVDYAQTVKFFNNTEDKLVTAGSMKIIIWEFNVAMRLLKPTDTNLGRIKRAALTIVSFF
jgi:WD40 repeat protein